jgi:hypothetical protein
MTSGEVRRYRFGPSDRTGWLLGLRGAQCTALAAAIVASGVMLNIAMPAPLVLLPLVAGGAFAFGTWNGQHAWEVVPVALAWSAARVIDGPTWFAPIPRLRPGSRASTSLPLPDALDGMTIDESAAPSGRRGRASGCAVIRDRRDTSASATLRVRGREFALCEAEEQERLLQLWGDALAAFCVERGAVSRIRWTEWAAPAGVGEQLAYLAEHQPVDRTAAPVAAYRELLQQAGPMATRHEVLVTVTVNHRQMRRDRRGRGSSLDGAAEGAVLDEVRLLASRLETGGFVADGPLSPSETAAVMRSRLDPFAAGPRTPTRGASLASLAGFVSPDNAGPLAVHAAWDHVRVDGAVHAAYVVAEWPRLEVPANWMEPLLLHAGGIRTVAVHYEPVAPSRSQRNVDRETVKLASDEEQRTRTGFRIGARHRRAQSEVLDREAELVAGYGEFEFAGFVVVTARDLDELHRSCVEYEQVAAQAGLELRRLDGRHDLALACALPVGRGIARRRFA